MASSRALASLSLPGAHPRAEPVLRRRSVETIEPDDIDRALDGDEDAMRVLVQALRPAVQMEVAWTLQRFTPRGRGRDPRQELADMVQEVFLSLLEQDGRALRAWNPSRGRTLASFVRLIARHQVISLVRSDRRCPWTEDPTPVEDMELEPTPSPEASIADRDEARRVMNKLRDELSTRSMLIFESLYIEHRSVEEVCGEFGLTKDALYAWRSRLKQKLNRVIRRLQRGQSHD